MPTEEELIKAAVAPRVTLAQLEDTIAGEHYFTAWDGAIQATGGVSEVDNPLTDHLKLLTFCVLVLKNGFTVTGESACASPENYNEKIGRELARKQAIGKVWPLLGYELKTKLTETV